MSVYDQIVTTYSDTTPHVRVISDIIAIIDPVDTPLIDALGLAGANGKFNIRQNGKKIELLEDEYDPLETTASDTDLTNDSSATNWTVTDASVFQPGHVILMDSEYCVVKAVDTSADTITVYARDYGGTQATHASDVTIEIVGMAREEGADADYGPIVDVSAPYNYTNIFQKGIKVSRTQREIDQYGKVDEFSYQANKAVPHLLRLVERAAFHGVRAAGSASTPRSMGGLGTFITDNTVSAGGGITKTDVDDLAEKIMLDGGMPDLLVLHPSIARDLKDVIDTSDFVRVNQEVQALGTMPLKRVNTQYGPLRLLESRWCPSSTSYMLDSRKVGFYTLTPFNFYELAKTGDSDKGEVVGEFSLLVQNDKAHGKITGITT